MTLENPEIKQSRLADKDFYDKVVKRIRDELEELSTDPHDSKYFDAESVVQLDTNGQMKWQRMLEDFVVRVGQDLRLTHDEIDDLKNRIFEQ